MTALSEIKQFHSVISEAVKSNPAASVRGELYINHVSTLAGAVGGDQGVY